MQRRLVLFDIDGTLIRDDGAAREAYSEALAAVYDFTGPITGYDFSGKTDPQITYWVLGDAGYSRADVDAHLPRFWDHYISGLESRVSRDRVHLLDGVKPLLDRLDDDERVLIALLTGNIEPGARLKLAPHELHRHFAFGAYGSDHEDRSALPPIAVSRAELHSGLRFNPRDVVIIGDSIWDIRCGVPHRATTIAVATGRTTAETLHAEEPDHLFESLEPTDALLAAILGESR